MVCGGVATLCTAGYYYSRSHHLLGKYNKCGSCTVSLYSLSALLRDPNVRYELLILWCSYSCDK